MRVLGLMLLCLAAFGAQAGELKVATWNLEWLTLRQAGDPVLPENVVPKGPADWAVLRGYALALDADVVAMQEVDGPEAAARVFPRERYSIVMTGDGVVQRVGFAIRRGIAFERNADLVALDIDPEARFRLRSGADVTLVLPGGRLRLLNVHLKSGCHSARIGGSRACETLRQQVPALRGWIAQRVAEGVPFLMMGDFNRRMDHRDEMLAALNASAPLARATEGRATPCWGGNSFIDHILAGGAARGWMRSESLKVMVYREGAEAKGRLSDHCPVSVMVGVPG